MVVVLAQGPYGMLLLSGLIPQAETLAVRMFMLPTWIVGVWFAVWKGRRAVLGAWADRELVRVLGDLNALTRITALYRRERGGGCKGTRLEEGPDRAGPSPWPWPCGLAVLREGD
ncbi:hypothetical protein [Streptomyces parvulus]|uniref:hypothetical protein n=1 Tax=Streptomyces parvulus TaxID=146923 RepID=UPI0033CEED33